MMDDHTQVPGLWQGISIVVIGRNEGQRLVRCLESIRASDYPQDRIEVIYVDTNSTDGSQAAAERLGASLVAINPARPTAAAARNAGLGVASKELIHFLDGDTLLAGSWLKKAVEEMDRTGAACVFGRREEVAPHATIYNFWTHHDWYIPPGEADHCTGDALFRVEALREVGGFDASLIAGEDQDLIYRLHQRGYVAWAVDELMTLHDINMRSVKEYWCRCFRAGHAYAEVSDRHAGLVKWRRTCRRNWAHVLAPALAAVLCIVTGSLWPVAVWMGAVIAAIVRDTFRCRTRVGSLGEAFFYSLHHYLSKVPTAFGQCSYRLRRVFALSPQPLVEYRAESQSLKSDR